MKHSLIVDDEILAVENPVYQTEDEIYAKYKGFHFLVTNLKYTEPEEPEGWVGGIVQYYSKNYQKMSKLLIESRKIEAFGDSLLSYGGDDMGSLGAVLVC